jgi:hypothetical protein
MRAMNTPCLDSMAAVGDARADPRKMNVQSQEQVSASWDLALGDFASLWSILSKAFGKLTAGASPSPSSPAAS